MQRDDIINWGLLFGLGIIWGFSFFFIQKGLISFSPIQVGATRIFFAFLAMIPVILFIGIKFPKEKLPLIVLSAFLGSGIPSFLFAIAQTKISSSVTGILNSLTPLFALVLGAILFKIKMKPIHIIGVLLGLVGTVIVVVLRSDGSFDFNFGFSLLIVLATAMYGTNANIIKSKLFMVHPIQLAILTFCITGPIAGVYLFSTDFVEIIRVHEHGKSSFLYLVILSVIGTAYSLILFNYLTFRTSALFATMVTYIIPMVAVVIGIFIGESIGITHIVGLFLILMGVYVSSIKRKPKEVISSKANHLP